MVIRKIEMLPWLLLARFINFFIKVQPKHWVFSADYGNMYREGSKYLLEYMLVNHTDYHCTFITRNKSVYNTLKNKHIPCEMNYSLKAIFIIAKAECVFTTQSPNEDILFCVKKKNRRFFYLVHGMPLKIALGQLVHTKFYSEHIEKKRGRCYKLIKSIYSLIKSEYGLKDIEFVSATSDFLAQFQRKEFDPHVAVKVLGMPRNDALFQPKRMEQENWITIGTENKLVITYMPTHRAYGKGKITPTPFMQRSDIQEWLKENNVLLLIKNHPNMIPKIQNTQETEVIKDITKLQLDPQVCIYHSDVLITDFSSVWMDYLLLRRPIIFYIYDDFEHDDVGTYYDIREDSPGYFCYSEDGLFDIIKRIKTDYDKMIPSERIVRKYHKYIDGNSCERYYREITKSAF